MFFWKTTDDDLLGVEQRTGKETLPHKVLGWMLEYSLNPRVALLGLGYTQ
jgi:hypothetical protein